MSDQVQRIKKIMPIVNAASPTFCLAKWHHVTLYLQTGETHSCYHPAPHKIDLREIKNNPSALHNTSHKKLERKEMLNGIQTEYLKSVCVVFTTPLKKDCVIEIDLTDEEKYQDFLYS